MFDRAKTKDVQEVISKGKSKHFEHVSVRSIKTSSPTKATVVISKKVEKTAVGRNRIKRRVREILKEVKLPNERTIIIYAKKGINEIKREALKVEIQEAVK
ncbi:ribonuclease P protein component [Candidatus Kaiserbacteria bacterium]|nr:MAG: ribonuclease P protein component [Candidatus Kaiserbacteria bacterium]